MQTVLNGNQEEMEKMGSERNVKSSHQNNNPVYICLKFWQFWGFWGLEVLVVMVLPFKARTLFTVQGLRNRLPLFTDKNTLSQHQFASRKLSYTCTLTRTTSNSGY